VTVKGYSLNPLVLAACPSYAGKEPVLKQWYEGLKAQTYENLQLFLVDNTVFGTQFLKVVQDMGIPSIHLQPWTDKPFEQHTFKRCWELIIDHAREIGADWVFSVEADNVPAPEALDKMLEIATFAQVHLVTADYPMHESAAKASGKNMEEFFYAELGCMLVSTDLLESAMSHYDFYHKLSVAIFGTAAMRRAGWCRLTTLFEVKHLDDAWPTEYPQYPDELDPDDPAFCPTPVPPDNFGTEIPSCLKKDLLEEVE
jgi:hypothetical protein